METFDYLAIYLDDHRAGAAGGVQLARRIADQYRGRPGFEAAPDLADEIEQDAESLDRLRERLGVDGGWQGRAKRLLALVGEQVGRLKPNGHLTDPSPLSPVEELEAMAAGVFVKRGLWRTLRQLADQQPFADVLAADELDLLLDRAEEQLIVVDQLHHRAVAELA